MKNKTLLLVYIGLIISILSLEVSAEENIKAEDLLQLQELVEGTSGSTSEDNEKEYIEFLTYKEDKSRRLKENDTSTKMTNVADI